MLCHTLAMFRLSALRDFFFQFFFKEFATVLVKHRLHPQMNVCSLPVLAAGEAQRYRF